VSAVEWILLIAAGWVGLSLLVALVILPLVRVGSRADALTEHAKAYAPRPEPKPRPNLRVLHTDDPAVSLLRESGYLGLVLERLVLHARTIFAADEVYIFGRDLRGRDDRLVLAQGAGVNPDLIGRRCFTLDWAPVAGALAMGRPLAVPGELWPAWLSERENDEAAGNAAVAPVWFGGRIHGAVSVIHRRGGRGLRVSSLDLLGELAQLVGQVLGHAEARQLSLADPQPEIDGLLGALARIERSPETGGQGAEISAVARWIAEDLELTRADRIEIELAARLHDVGKLRLPSRVLGGADELTRSELDLLRLHPLWGSEMVARIPGLEAVAMVVRFAHERWDGSGYPDGLEGARIPLASRIVAVADAFCAMTSQRTPGPPLNPPGVLQELQLLAGSELDPDLTTRLARVVAGAEVRHPA
jgi:HD domain/GAF domain